MALFRTALINAVTKSMQGRKCDCTGCNCHYGKADAEKLVAAMAPVITDEYAKLVHDDLKERLNHFKAAFRVKKK